MRITMGDIFPAVYIDRLKEAIEHLLGEIKRLRIENGGVIFPGSQAATEQSTYANSGAVTSASLIAEPLIELGADHLSVFKKILLEPVEVTATWTCVRSMMESCGLA